MIKEIKTFHVTCDGKVPDGTGHPCNSQHMVTAYDEGDAATKVGQRGWRTAVLIDHAGAVQLCPGMHAPDDRLAAKSDGKIGHFVETVDTQQDSPEGAHP